MREQVTKHAGADVTYGCAFRGLVFALPPSLILWAGVVALLWRLFQ